MAQGERLPEGTDKIINGASITASDVVVDERPAAPHTEDATGGGGGLKDQLRDRAQSLKQTATARARDYAEDGRGRVTSALDSFAEAVSEAAGQVDERFGAEYGEYARRAAGSMQGLADNLRDKNLDELYDESVALVRKSPAVAVGTAAALGFALVRLAKAGLEESGGTSAGEAGKSSGGTRASSDPA